MTAPRFAGFAIFAAGVVVVLGGLAALAGMTGWALKDLWHPQRYGYNSDYGPLLLPPGAFLCGLVVIAGLALALAGRRLTGRFRPPPSAPPPG